MAVMTGREFTVIVLDAVLLHPAILVPVTVYVVVPDGVAVTGVPVDELKPVAGLQVYELPPEAPMVVDAPAQIVAVPPLAVIVGMAFTVKALVAVLLQPEALVPVMVYVVVTVGVAVTVVPVDELRLAAGVHVYVLPPEALIVVDAPAHIVVAPPFAVMVGNAFTVTCVVVLVIVPVVLQVPVPVQVIVQ